MSKIKITLFFLFVVGSVFSQNTSLIPSKGSNGLWGAVDNASELVIPFKFDRVGFYSFNYFLVEKNGKKGLFDATGEEVLSVKYDAIKPIDKYTFQVFIGGKSGVVNSRESEILPIEFKSILYREGKGYYIVSKKGKYSVYSSRGKQLIPFDFDNISFYGDKYFLYQKDKEFAVYRGIASESDLEFYDDVVRSGNFFLVRDGSDWGVLDSNSNVIIKTKYEVIKLFGNEKYFIVKNNGSYAFFNLEGERFTKFKFDKPFYYFDNNVLWYQTDGSWMRYDFDTKDEELLSITRIIDEVDGYIRVVKDNFVELVDGNEATLFGGKYQDVIPLKGNLFKVQFLRKWGVVDSYDKQILDIAFDHIHLNTVDKDDFKPDFMVGEDVKVGDGKIYSDLFTVRNNGKFGVYSTEGKEVVPVDYDEVEVSVNNLMVRVKSKDRYNVYNRQGDKLFDNNYKSIDWSENQKYMTLYADTTIYVSDTLGVITKLKNVNSVKWSLKKGLFFDVRDGVYGLRSINSDTIIDYKYKEIYDLENHYFVGVVESGVYLFNSDGSKLVDFKIKSIEIANKKDAFQLIVLNDKGFGVLDKKGKTIIPFEYSRIWFDKVNKLYRVEKDSKFIGYIGLDGKKYF